MDVGLAVVVVVVVVEEEEELDFVVVPKFYLRKRLQIGSDLESTVDVAEHFEKCYLGYNLQLELLGSVGFSLGRNSESILCQKSLVVLMAYLAMASNIGIC